MLKLAWSFKIIWCQIYHIYVPYVHQNKKFTDFIVIFCFWAKFWKNWKFWKFSIYVPDVCMIIIIFTYYDVISLLRKNKFSIIFGHLIYKRLPQYRTFPKKYFCKTSNFPKIMWTPGEKKFGPRSIGPKYSPNKMLDPSNVIWLADTKFFKILTMGGA